MRLTMIDRHRMVISDTAFEGRQQVTVRLDGFVAMERQLPHLVPEGGWMVIE